MLWAVCRALYVPEGIAGRARGRSGKTGFLSLRERHAMYDPPSTLWLLLEALSHRKICLGGEGLAEVVPVMAGVLAEVEVKGMDTQAVRQWLRERIGIDVPAATPRADTKPQSEQGSADEEVASLGKVTAATATERHEEATDPSAAAPADVELAKTARGQPGRRRAWNRLSAGLESAILSDLRSGLSKSEVARRYKLTRRTIQRVAARTASVSHETGVLESSNA